jgi:hypothetical protein
VSSPRFPGRVEQRAAKLQWFVKTSPWTALAPVIADGLDREFLNGVRLCVGSESTSWAAK